jgi:hypothetical protein
LLVMGSVEILSVDDEFLKNGIQSWLVAHSIVSFHHLCNRYTL